MVDDRDEMIERVAEALRPLPVADASAKARVLVAVAAERERDREAAARTARRRSTMRRLVRGTGLAAAGAVAALWLRAVWTVPAATMAVSGTTPAASPTGEATAGRLAAADADVAVTARRPVELVLRAPAARTVRVVGDFNGWDGGRSPLVRDPASGLWSVTLALTPGRHVYAFIVDDTLWMRDPRMPAAPDADFGRPGSVLLVGQP